MELYSTINFSIKAYNVAHFRKVNNGKVIASVDWELHEDMLQEGYYNLRSIRRTFGYKGGHEISWELESETRSVAESTLRENGWEWITGDRWRQIRNFSPENKDDL